MIAVVGLHKGGFGGQIVFLVVGFAGLEGGLALVKIILIILGELPLFNTRPVVLGLLVFRFRQIFQGIDGIAGKYQEKGQK